MVSNCSPGLDKEGKHSHPCSVFLRRCYQRSHSPESGGHNTITSIFTKHSLALALWLGVQLTGVAVTSFSSKLTLTSSFLAFFSMMVMMTWDSVWYQSYLIRGQKAQVWS